MAVIDSWSGDYVVVEDVYIEAASSGAVGISMGATGGRVVGCDVNMKFQNEETAIEVYSNHVIVAQNHIRSGKIEHSGGYGSIIDNTIDQSGFQQYGIILDAVTNLTVIGNTFDGQLTNAPWLELRGACADVAIIGNVAYAQGISLGDGANAGSIRGILVANNVLSANSASDVATISYSAASAAAWSVQDVLIVGNKLGAWGGGGGGRIEILGDAISVGNLAIIDNHLASIAFPIGGPFAQIDVQYGRDIDNSGMPIKISGNMARIVDDADAFAIRVRGISGDKDRGSVMVTDNDVQGRVEIVDIRDVVFTGNFHGSIGDNPSDQTYTTGQVEITNVANLVFGRNVWIGGENTTDPAGTGALIYLEADEGSVRDNDIWGMEAGAMDTALEIVGAMLVDGNRYHGLHPMHSGGSAFTNEIVISGTGTILGENYGAVDLTGATTPEVSFIETWFFIDGTITTGVKPRRYYFGSDIEVMDFFPVADTAPVGADMIIDVNDDTSSIFPTATKPTIADGNNEGAVAVPDTTALTEGNYLQLEVDQVGSSTPGSDVSILMRYRRA